MALADSFNQGLRSGVLISRARRKNQEYKDEQEKAAKQAELARVLAMERPGQAIPAPAGPQPGAQGAPGAPAQPPAAPPAPAAGAAIPTALPAGYAVGEASSADSAATASKAEAIPEIAEIAQTEDPTADLIEGGDTAAMPTGPGKGTPYKGAGAKASDWAEYRRKLNVAAAATGDPETVKSVNAYVDGKQHEGFMRNANMAQMLLEKSPETAIKYLENAYQYVPDGISAKFEVAPSGKGILMKRYNEVTGEMAQPGGAVLTPQFLGQLIANQSDPVKFAMGNREQDIKRQDAEAEEAMRRRASEYDANTPEGRAALAKLKSEEQKNRASAASSFASAEKTRQATAIAGEETKEERKRARELANNLTAARAKEASSTAKVADDYRLDRSIGNILDKRSRLVKELEKMRAEAETFGKPINTSLIEGEIGALSKELDTLEARRGLRGSAIPTTSATPTIPVGTTRGGYRFVGGDPNDRKSWKAVE